MFILSTFRELACMSNESTYSQGYPDSKADVSSMSPSSFALKKGCCSKRQPGYLFTVANFHYNSVDRTKLSCYTDRAPAQHHSFFRNLFLLFICDMTQKTCFFILLPRVRFNIYYSLTWDKMGRKAFEAVLRDPLERTKLAKTSGCWVKFPHSPILHYTFSSWTEKSITKTIHFHWENRFVLQ